jgi:HK97 family phage prohead protease
VTTAGEFSGYASVFDVVDRQREVTKASCFAETLTRFATAGVIAWQHDHARPVAVALECREDSRGLFLRGAFHSTADGQMARTVVTERLDAGKSVGLSIGYRVVRDRWVGAIRELLEVDLYEISIVSVPALPSALVAAAKAKGLSLGEPVALKAAPSKAVPIRHDAAVLEAIAHAAEIGVPITSTSPQQQIAILTGQARRMGVKV